MFTQRDRTEFLQIQAAEKYLALSHRFNHTPDYASQSALKGFRQRLTALAKQPWLSELFTHQIFSLNDLDDVSSFKEATIIVDDYYRIANFYAKNRAALRWLLLNDKFFQVKMADNHLACWRALMESPINYKNFNYSQTTAYVHSILMSIPTRSAALIMIMESYRDASAPEAEREGVSMRM